MTATGVNRAYDGGTVATVTLATNKVGDDAVTAAYNDASFEDKDVGTGKTIHVSGISIAGTDAANYRLART